MNSIQEPSGSKIKRLVLIFFISFLFQLVFAIFAFVYVAQKGVITNETEFTIVLKYITIGMVLIALPGSDYIYKKKIRAADDKYDPNEKIQVYQIALIIKLAILELVNILSIISYLLTGSNTYLLMSGILLVYFLLNKPNKEKIIEEFVKP